MADKNCGNRLQADGSFMEEKGESIRRKKTTCTQGESK